MKKSLFAIAAATAVLAGCQQEAFVKIESAKTVNGAIIATIADGETRTNIAEDGSVYHVNWTAMDKIKIVDAAEKTDIYYTEAGGAPSAEFWFSYGDTIATEGLYKAYYPSFIANGKLASIQNYSKNGISESPMYAECTADGTNTPVLAFKNLCGILKFNVTSSVAGTKILSIAIKADQGMSGEYTIADNAAVVTGTEGVSIFCGTEGVEVGETPVPFCFSVPANTYTGMEITVTTTDGKTQTLKMKSGASIKVERSQVQEGAIAFNSLTAPTVTFGGSAILPAGPDFNASLKIFFDEGATNTTDDENIRKIVFNVNSPITTEVEIHDIASDLPIYLAVDPSGVAMVYTPASEFVVPSDGSFMFAYMGALESIVNLNTLNTANCEDMTSMFNQVGTTYSQLSSLDLSKFNTAQCTSMRSMFNGARSLAELDLSTFNTQNVETMAYMFAQTKSLGHVNLANWTNDVCEDFSYFFNGSGVKTVDLTNFQTPCASTMLYMFASCYNLESVDMSSFCTENVTTFGNMFYQTYHIQAINGLTSFDTSASTIFRSMFNRCDDLISIDCSTFDVSSSTNCQYMFYKMVNLQKLDIRNMDISGLTASTFAYFMPKLQSLQELYLGEYFIPSDPQNVPNAFTMLYADTEEESCACQSPVGLTVYCSEDVAQYMITTDFHYPHNGWNYTTKGYIHNPVNIVFKDINTGREINVSWPENEKYPL